MRQLWRSAPAEHTLWTDWDGVHLVHHKPSGRTHLLNEQAVDLLRNVLGEPKPTDAAMQELAEHLTVAADDAFSRYFADLMAHLEELGLVVRA